MARSLKCFFRWFALTIGLPEDSGRESNCLLDFFYSSYLGIFIGWLLCGCALYFIAMLLCREAMGFEPGFKIVTGFAPLTVGMAVWSCVLLITIPLGSYFCAILGARNLGQLTFAGKFKGNLVCLRACLAGGLLIYGLVGIAAAILVLFVPAVWHKYRSRIVSHALC